MSRAVRVALAAAALTAATACADLSIERPVDAIRTPIDDPSFGGDIQPILTETCASSGACHAGATPQQDLSLEAGMSYASLVGVASRMVPALLRVRPFEPDSSYFLLIMSEDPAERRGNRRMPLTRYPMPSPVVQTIRNWIQGGAPNN
ncbi:MAG: hypothetical protein HY705_00360 [Gemmatimonadetes bacterium]|nr:hypothetical protein [Gemmatimonadota bacterium]